jgi:hypothetical protein
MSNESRTTEQGNAYHALVAELRMDADQKEALILAVSGGDFTSSKDLTKRQMGVAISRLTQMKQAKIDKMRTKANGIARSLGYIKGNDYTSMNTFLNRQFKARNIFGVSYADLPVLITVLEKMLKAKQAKQVSECLA